MLTLTPSKTLSDEPICSHTCSMDHLMISQYWRKSADTMYCVFPLYQGVESTAGCWRNPVPELSAEKGATSRLWCEEHALAPTTTQSTSCMFHANAHPGLAPSCHG